jgi:hypothetical protein
MKELGTDQKTTRKAQQTELSRHQKGHNAARATHESHRKAYEKATRDLIEAQHKEEAGKQAGSKKVPKVGVLDARAQQLSVIFVNFQLPLSPYLILLDAALR